MKNPSLGANSVTWAY